MVDMPKNQKINKQTNQPFSHEECKKNHFLSGVLHKNAASNFVQVLKATTHKATAVRPSTAHHENYQS